MSIEKIIRGMIENGNSGTITLHPGIEIVGKIVSKNPSVGTMTYSALAVSMDKNYVFLEMPPKEGETRGYMVKVPQKSIKDAKYN